MGTTRIAEHDYAGAVVLLTAAAVVDAADDLELLVQVRLLPSRAHTMTGRHVEARQHAELAVVSAEQVGVPHLISQALALHAVLACAHGFGRDEVTLHRARDLEVIDAGVAAPFSASTADAVTLDWTGRLDEALAGFFAARRRCLKNGSDVDLMYVSGHLAMVYL